MHRENLVIVASSSSRRPMAETEVACNRRARMPKMVLHANAATANVPSWRRRAANQARAAAREAAAAFFAPSIALYNQAATNPASERSLGCVGEARRRY